MSGPPFPASVGSARSLAQQVVGSRLRSVARLGRSLVGSTPTGIPILMPLKIAEVQLPYEPLVTLSVQKNIVQTPLAGHQRAGAVKELVSTSDFSASDTGFYHRPGRLSLRRG